MEQDQNDPNTCKPSLDMQQVDMNQLPSDPNMREPAVDMQQDQNKSQQDYIDNTKSTSTTFQIIGNTEDLPLEGELEETADPWPTLSLVHQLPSFADGAFKVKISTTNPNWNWHASLSWQQVNCKPLASDARIMSRSLKCQGVHICCHFDTSTGRECDKVLRAPTDPKQQKKWLNGQACGKCGNINRKAVPCGVMLYKRVCTPLEVVMLEQSGTHDHGFPDLEKAMPKDMNIVKDLVVAYPQSKARTLATGVAMRGETGNKQPIHLSKKPGAVSDAFLNLNRLAYHRRNWLNKEGISPDTGGITDV